MLRSVIRSYAKKKGPNPRHAGTIHHITDNSEEQKGSILLKVKNIQNTGQLRTCELDALYLTDVYMRDVIICTWQRKQV